jgi:hypothetical protein
MEQIPNRVCDDSRLGYAPCPFSAAPPTINGQKSLETHGKAQKPLAGNAVALIFDDKEGRAIADKIDFHLGALAKKISEAPSRS